ncbi:hypothetical protein M514_07947, partial [Trichuris suis]
WEICCSQIRAKSRARSSIIDRFVYLIKEPTKVYLQVMPSTSLFSKKEGFTCGKLHKFVMSEHTIHLIVQRIAILGLLNRMIRDFAVDMFSAAVDTADGDWMTDPLEIIKLIDNLILGQIEDMATMVFELKRTIWGKIDSFISNTDLQKSGSEDEGTLLGNSHPIQRNNFNDEVLYPSEESASCIRAFGDTGYGRTASLLLTRCVQMIQGNGDASSYDPVFVIVENGAWVAPKAPKNFQLSLVLNKRTNVSGHVIREDRLRVPATQMRAEHDKKCICINVFKSSRMLRMVHYGTPRYPHPSIHSSKRLSVLFIIGCLPEETTLLLTELMDPHHACRVNKGISSSGYKETVITKQERSHIPVKNEEIVREIIDANDDMSISSSRQRELCLNSATPGPDVHLGGPPARGSSSLSAADHCEKVLDSASLKHGSVSTEITDCTSEKIHQL